MLRCSARNNLPHINLLGHQSSSWKTSWKSHLSIRTWGSCTILSNSLSETYCWLLQSHTFWAPVTEVLGSWHRRRDSRYSSSPGAKRGRKTDFCCRYTSPRKWVWRNSCASGITYLSSFLGSKRIKMLQQILRTSLRPSVQHPGPKLPGRPWD